MEVIEKIMGGGINFKQVDQVGFVVEDMEDAIRNFSDKLGVRDWYRPRKSEEDEGKIIYRGEEIVPEIDFVLGYCGRLQFELVTTGGPKNIYSEHLERHGEGLHHICFFIKDIDATMAEYKKMGVEPIQTGSVLGKGGAVTRYAYMDGSLTNGLIVELSETKLFGINTKMSPVMMKVGHLTGDLEKVT